MDILIKPKKNRYIIYAIIIAIFFYGGDEYFFNEYECG